MNIHRSRIKVRCPASRNSSHHAADWIRLSGLDFSLPVGDCQRRLGIAFTGTNRYDVFHRFRSTTAAEKALLAMPAMPLSALLRLKLPRTGMVFGADVPDLCSLCRRLAAASRLHYSGKERTSSWWAAKEVLVVCPCSGAPCAAKKLPPMTARSIANCRSQ